MEPFEFLSSDEVSHGHAGLGSGKPFSVSSDKSKIQVGHIVLVLKLIAKMNLRVIHSFWF